MSTASAPCPETAEILESLTFIEKECLAAWQASAKTPKELGLLREARACIQLRMKILGIGAPKPAATPAPAESQAPHAQPEATADAVSETPPAATETPLESFRLKYTPESFGILDIYTRMGVLQRFGISEAEARANGYKI